MSSIPDGVSRSCEICEYKTNRAYNFTRHIDTMHMPGEKKFTCLICNIDYDTKYELLVHRSEVHKEGYKCPHCTWNFTKPALLTRHLYVHTGEVLFKCLCGYGTSHKFNMDRHKKSCTINTENVAVDVVNDIEPISNDILQTNNDPSLLVVAKPTKRKRSESSPDIEKPVSTPRTEKEVKKSRGRPPLSDNPVTKTRVSTPSTDKEIKKQRGRPSLSDKSVKKLKISPVKKLKKEKIAVTPSVKKRGRPRKIIDDNFESTPIETPREHYLSIVTWYKITQRNAQRSKIVEEIKNDESECGLLTSLGLMRITN